MSKRNADGSEEDTHALKQGNRPVQRDTPDDAGHFEDDFEDEFESDDEIMEAGVDGGPDDERETQEMGGM